MTEIEIQLLKNSVDKLVQIQTTDGELLTARVISVFHDAEYDEHEIFYKLVSSNMFDSYARLEEVGGYGLDFEKILSVRPYAGLSTKAKELNVSS